jgi:ornithine carbamoyltransferase
MPFNLRRRDFATLTAFQPVEIRFLVQLARDLKAAKYGRYEKPRLIGKNIALIFEKTSTRIRCAFEVAAHDQGAEVTYVGPHESQIGYKESLKDTARVLSRFYDAIEFRVAGQEIVDAVVQFSDIPIYNGLTSERHPTQFLADAMTMLEHMDKPASQCAFCYIGDCRFSTAESLLIGGAQMGMDIRLCGPRALWPASAVVDCANRIAEETGARVTLTQDPESGVRGVDFMYTDVWVSLGEPESACTDRIDLLMPYQVNRHLMELSGNPGVKFMHCLPAFHNRETELGEHVYQTFGIDAMEVTEEVFESRASIVFDQAENRMHTIKSILVATLA